MNLNHIYLMLIWKKKEKKCIDINSIRGITFLFLPADGFSKEPGKIENWSRVESTRYIHKINAYFDDIKIYFEEFSTL